MRRVFSAATKGPDASRLKARAVMRERFCMIVVSQVVVGLARVRKR
jgi:hypothetical protein